MSLDQDQLIYYQDSPRARACTSAACLMAAALDALYAANQEPLPVTADNTLGGALVGKLDFSRVGLMGHSRGGDAVSSFIDYNRTRPGAGPQVQPARRDRAGPGRLRAASARMACRT